MRKMHVVVVWTGTAVLLLAQASGAWAGLFRGPYDFSIGPYRGDPYGWSYNESYGYFGVPSTSTYPYFAYFPYTIYTPYAYGLGFNRNRYFGGLNGLYGMNPAYLIPPRPPGYRQDMKAMAKDVMLPPLNQVNWLAAVIEVKMPCFGELWVDGVPTEQLGTERLFRSPPLEKGGEYIYVLRARWREDGKIVEQTQDVRVHCGDRVQVIFPKPVQPAQP